MEENNTITNLNNIVSNSAFVNTEPVYAEPQKIQPEVIPNNTQENYNATHLQQNVVSVEQPKVDYMNMYNQQAMKSIVENIQSNEQPASVISEETIVNGVESLTQQNIIPDTVHTTTAVVNPTQNITIGSPAAQQMAQADVVQTTVSGVSQNLIQTIPSNQLQDTIETYMEPVVEVKQEDTEETKLSTQEPVVQSGKQYCYKLKTQNLVNIVNNVKKAAIGEDRLLTTTIIQLVFSPEGLELKATDSLDILTQIDTSTKFVDNCTLCVNAELFTKLVNKLDTEEVELEYDKENHILNVHSNGVFKIPEQYDPGTGLPINIPDESLEVLPTDVHKVVNIDTFKNLIQRSNVFAGNSNIYAQLSGVYCADKIYSTDKVCMFCTDNIPELKDETFYMSPQFVSLLITTDFDEEVNFYFRKDATNNTAYIIVKDSVRTLGGPVSDYTDKYPLEAINRITVMNYNNDFNVNKNLLISILDKASLFIEKNSKSQSCNFVVNNINKTLSVQTFNKQADQIISIDGQNIPQGTYCLKVENMMKALRNCVDDTVTIYTDESNDTCCKIVSDDITQSVSYSNDNN